MKKTLIALVALSGLAMADTVTNTVDLSDLMSVETGVVFGGDNSLNTQSGTTVSAEALADFTTMSQYVTATNTWYTDNNYSNVNNGAKPTDAYGITMITDGPAPATGHCSWIAFAYQLDSATLADMAEAESSLAITFNVKVSGGNNNNKGQGVAFNLLTAANNITQAQYGNTSGTDTAAEDVTLTLSAAKVAQLAATGTNQNLIFLMTDTDNVTGTNEYWTVTNMKLTYNTPAPVVPEPATATLSLLALAGLAARRRRH